MTEKILPTQPAAPEDSDLIEEFGREIIKQGERLDDVAKELFKLELAIPGIYAVALRLVVDKDVIPMMIVVAFAFWSVALGLTLWSIFPKRYNVLRSVPRWADKRTGSNKMSIEEFYTESARRKYRLLLGASICFFCGIVCAVWAVFQV